MDGELTGNNKSLSVAPHGDLVNSVWYRPISTRFFPKISYPGSLKVLKLGSRDRLKAFPAQKPKSGIA